MANYRRTTVKQVALGGIGGRKVFRIGITGMRGTVTLTTGLGR